MPDKFWRAPECNSGEYCGSPTYAFFAQHSIHPKTSPGKMQDEEEVESYRYGKDQAQPAWWIPNVKEWICNKGRTGKH
jgi:hypothetical protein